jgi:hypothetical protein
MTADDQQTAIREPASDSPAPPVMNRSAEDDFFYADDRPEGCWRPAAHP